MFFKTENEIRDVIQKLGYTIEELEFKNSPDYPLIGGLRFYIEKTCPRTYPLAKLLVSWLGEHRRDSILWITEYGIWPSSENEHLYYRLRMSYGDFRILHEAPGHFFLAHETADLVTFIDLALQFGWGGHIITAKGFPYIFISHDGWILVESVPNVQEIIKNIEDFEFPYDYKGPVETGGNFSSTN